MTGGEMSASRGQRQNREDTRTRQAKTDTRGVDVLELFVTCLRPVYVID